MSRQLSMQEHWLQVQILSTDGNRWTWPCMLVGPVLQGERQETSGICQPACKLQVQREALSRGTKAESGRAGYQCVPLASAQIHAPHTCTLTQRRTALKVWTVQARDKRHEETEHPYPTLDRGPRAPDRVTTSNPILLPPCLTSCV